MRNTENMKYLEMTNQPQLRSLRLLSVQVVTIITALLTLSCGELVEADMSLEEGYQVFGIRVDPPVARPDDQVVMTVYDHHPRLQNFEYSWSLCLYSHGAPSYFKCLNELSLPESDKTPRIVVDLSERGIDLRKRLRALGQSLNTNGERRSLDEGLDIFIILNSGLPNKRFIQTVKRIRVIDAPGESPLAENPKLKEWTVTESGVANLLPSCTVKPATPLNTLRYNEAGEVISGTLRESVLGEITGQTSLETMEELEGGGAEPCTFHNQSLLDLTAEVKGDYERDWSVNEGYTYRWYISDEQKALTPITGGGLGIAQFNLGANLRSVELYFTVRDPHGGFAAGRQDLQLVEGIKLR
jgi:hypothetical protein